MTTPTITDADRRHADELAAAEKALAQLNWKYGALGELAPIRAAVDEYMRTAHPDLSPEEILEQLNTGNALRFELESSDEILAEPMS